MQTEGAGTYRIEMLTQEQRDIYEKSGYIVLSNIFDENEFEKCSDSYNALFALKTPISHLEATWAGNWKANTDQEAQKMSVLSIHNLQCHGAIFTKMLLNEKLLDAVSDIIGSPNILLHHTKAHVKPPHIGSPFPTHQDYPYFPFKNHSMVAVFINMDDSCPENGGLAVFPGSHKLGPLQNASESTTHFYVDQEEFELKNGTPVYAKKGDVIIFSYFLVHGSYPNTSNRIRRMLLFQMMSAEDEPTKEFHLSPCHGMVLRGINAKRDADIIKRHLK